MHRFTKGVLIFLWVIIFSIVFAAIWLRTPSLWFINLPEPVWSVLTNTFGASCCENVADVNVLVGLLFGLLFSLVSLGVVRIVIAVINRRTSACHSSEKLLR